MSRRTKADELSEALTRTMEKWMEPNPAQEKAIQAVLFGPEWRDRDQRVTFSEDVFEYLKKVVLAKQVSLQSYVDALCRADMEAHAADVEGIELPELAKGCGKDEQGKRVRAVLAEHSGHPG